MKLFEATNGYIGESYTRCYVIAESEEQALKLAKESFKSEALKPWANTTKYDESYYTDIRLKMLCEDTSIEWASKPMS